jgi:hypothetical protein
MFDGTHPLVDLVNPGVNFLQLIKIETLTHRKIIELIIGLCKLGRDSCIIERNKGKYCILFETVNHQMRRILIISFIVFLLITIPFLIAIFSNGNDYVFGGFLANPLDGNSYLAKMMEGYRGAWTFTLPYSFQPGEGSFLFLFYILLGHITRIFGSQPLVIFHFSRLLSFGFLFFMIYRVSAAFFEKDTNKTWLGFLVLAVGSGMGWVVLPLGLRTSDLWVAEAYPFLSSFQNPHFPLGLGLMLLILFEFYQSGNKYTAVFLFLIGLMLAVILPFGAVVIGSVIFLEQVWGYIRTKSISIIRLVFLALGTLPFVAYQYLAVNAHPQLSIWNQQNLTPSPPFWDFALSFMPALILAFLAITVGYKKITSRMFFPLMVWLILGIVIIYLPIGIQRRFMVGYYFPVGLLASAFLFTIEKKSTRSILFSILIASSLITISIIILAGMTAISSRNPFIYLSISESDGLAWLNKNATPGQAVLADSRLGMFIPARTSLRVIYGHPFETIEAIKNHEIVDRFSSCKYNPDELTGLLNQYSIDYLMIDDETEKSCYPTVFQTLKLVFHEKTGSGNWSEIYKLK